MSELPPLPEVVKQQLVVSSACQYAGSLLEVLACGIQIFMVAQGYLGYASQIKSANLASSRRPYIAISFTILLISLVTTVAGAYENGRTMMRDMDLIAYGFFLRSGPMPWWINLSQAGLFVLVAIADGLLVYRCFIIWGARVSVVLLPGSIYVAYVATGVVSLVFNALPPDTIVNSKYALDVQAASAFLSAFGTLSATGLISYRLLLARREISTVLLREDANLYTRVIVTMIESALPLAVFGIIVAASNFLHGTAGRVAFTVIAGYIWEVLAMLSPQLIIYRVSMGNAAMVRTSAEGKVSSINFAHSHNTVQLVTKGESA